MLHTCDQPAAMPAPTLVHPTTRCVRCDYSLQGCGAHTSCPECNTPVSQSVRDDLLAMLPLAQVRTLARALWCLAATYGAIFLAGAASLLLMRLGASSWLVAAGLTCTFAAVCVNIYAIVVISRATDSNTSTTGSDEERSAFAPSHFPRNQGDRHALSLHNMLCLIASGVLWLVACAAVLLGADEQSPAVFALVILVVANAFAFGQRYCDMVSLIDHITFRLPSTSLRKRLSRMTQLQSVLLFASVSIVLVPLLLPVCVVVASIVALSLARAVSRVASNMQNGPLQHTTP